MFSRIVCSLMTVLVFAGLCVSDSFGLADCPKKLKIVSWEPFCGWEFSDSDWDKLEEEVIKQTLNKLPTYSATRYRDQSDGGSFEDCTREHFDGVAGMSGITFVSSHGNAGPELVAVTHESSSTLVAWVNGQSGLSVSQGTDIYTTKALYSVWATGAYFYTKWMNNHDTNKSIVFLAVCHCYTMVASMGGKTFFGYTGAVTVPQAVTDISNIFGRMNGTLPTWAQGTMRIASLAFDGYTKTSKIAMSGGDSALAPSPQIESFEPAPGSWVPDTGTGCIVFDSVMDTDVPSTSALTASTIGNVTITDVHWEGDSMIKFDWSGCGEWYVTMTAVAGSCKAPGSGIKLDGNRVAPNGDSKSWTFYSYLWG